MVRGRVKVGCRGLCHELGYCGEDVLPIMITSLSTNNFDNKTIACFGTQHNFIVFMLLFYKFDISPFTFRCFLV